MNIKRKITILISCIVLSIVAITSCKKDKFINPYDDPALKAPATNPDAANLSPSNFAYLHAKLFKPTCANSGCHDGTFPPEFRTINSAYNTLVYQKPINTDNGIFRYRVYPYKADSSILFHRLNVPLGSGLMPLVIDPQSDWTTKKDEYILDIKNWINAGAKDMFGNYPQHGNKQPQITGFLAFPAGNTSTPFARASGNIVPIEVPANSSVDLWFLIKDDSTSSANLTSSICKVSTSFDNFNTATNLTLSYNSSGITANDFTESASQFTHKTTFNTAGFPSGTYLYIKTFIDDGSQSVPTEIPNAGTSDIMSGYFALKIL
jgi:hypothetical protein